MATQALRYGQSMRFTGEQWSGLKKAAGRFRVTGRQNAQRQINQLFMAYFGLIDDPISSATMGAMIAERMQQKERLADGT
jgi:hypothetical protein